MNRRVLLAVLLTALSLRVEAATYYIDWGGGSDLNDGLTQLTPWQRHPYMAGWTASYTHVPGDVFVFKGGETWPHGCFPWHVQQGGVVGTPDVYTVDAGWFTGAGPSAPVFDAGGTELPGGYDVMLLMSLANRPHDILFDGLDFTGLYWAGNKAFSWVAYVNLSVSSNIVVQSCTFRDWSHAPMPTTDQLKVIIGANSPPFNPGCVLRGCLFDGGPANAGVGSSSGEATYAYSGDIVNCTVRNMASGFIVTGPPVPISPQIISGCDISTLNSYDPGAHPDAIFMNGGNLFFWHDNFLHDNWVENVFTGEGSGAEQVYLWNNVIYNCKTQPAIIANNNYAGAKIFAWNNTIVSGSYPAVRIANRNTGPVGVLDLRNNLFITDATVVSLDAGAAVTALTNANNVVLTTGAAFVQGYSEANRYQPTSAGAPTVGAGQAMPWLVPSFNSGAMMANGTVESFDGSGAGAARQVPWREPAFGSVRVLSSDVATTQLSDPLFPAGTAASLSYAFQSNQVAECDYTFATGMAVRRFTATSALPTTLTGVATNNFGDSDSRIGGLLWLNSGALLFAWHQHTVTNITGTNYMAVGIAYLPPGGSSWSNHYPVLVAGGVATSTGLADIQLAQHPVDGVVWGFFKRDGFPQIDAVKIVEGGGDVTVTVALAVISQAVDGAFGPEGEAPRLVAIPDPARNSILLAYQRNLFQVFSAVPFYKGAYLGLASMNTLGAPASFFSLDQWLERTSPFSMMVTTNGMVDVHYQTISAAGINPASQMSSWNWSSWLPTQISSTASNRYTTVKTAPGSVWKNTADNFWYLTVREDPLALDLLGVARPQGASWDAGAYEFELPPTDPGVISWSLAAVDVGQYSGFVGLTLTRSGGTAGDVSATLQTFDGTAVAGHDYAATTDTLNWFDGETGARSTLIPILGSGGDTAPTNRVFTVQITGVNGTSGLPSLGLTNVTVTILMTPPPPNAGVVALASAAASVSQNAGFITVSVIRSEGSEGAVTVTAATSDDTAVAGHDYTAVSTNLVWLDGELGVKSFNVPILASGDTALTNRVFYVDLSTSSVVTIGFPFFEQITILMNAPSANNGVLALATASASVPQAAGSITITVNRSAGTDGAAGVTASTVNGSATAGIDYTATTQLLSWGAGVGGSQSFSVPIINSGIVSATDRSFTVALSAATGGAAIGSPSNELVTIIMLPPPPTNGGVFSFSASGYSATLTSAVLTVTVLRTGSTNTAAAVSYATSNGSATAGIDYVATSGTLNWAANDNAAQTFQVPILNSGAAGPNRFFTLLLSNPTNGSTLGGPAAAMVSIQLNAPVGNVAGGLIRLAGQVTLKGSVTLGGF